MKIIDKSIDNRTAVIVFAVILFIAGIYCYNQLPRESSPDITIPYVFISTNYKGVSPQDIEKSITIPIEKKLKGLKDVKEIKSVSSEGISSISIEFVTGTDIDIALQKVKDKVDEAKGDLPQDLEDDPVVFEFNFSDFPVLVLSMSGSCGLERLKKIADDLSDDIEGVQGVLEAEVTGGYEREIRIEVHPEKLAAYAIPITSIQSSIAGENQNTSGGIIKMGDGKFQLRVPGEFSTPEEIINLVIGLHNGDPVYLKNVADVIDGYKDKTSQSLLNGVDAVNISVKKRTGTNIIEISDKIDKLIKESRKSWPSDTVITKLMDQARDIKLMNEDLENNLITGMLLVILIIPFAMGFRNAIIICTAIPFSMFLTFVALYLLGITMNMVVLFSLSLAVGMLVDNAIVIVENIYRFMQQGVPRVLAAKRASSEVIYPVISSTLTTVAAFFPLLFWPGIMGEFMKYLPITVIISLTASLLVAMIINPTVASFVIKVKGSIRVNQTMEEVIAASEKPAEPKGCFSKFYARILNFSLDNRIKVSIISFLCLFIFFKMWQYRIGIEKPVEFFPDIDPHAAYVNMIMPEGVNLDYCNRIAKEVQIKICTPPSKVENNDANTSLESRYWNAIKPRKHKRSNGKEFDGPSDFDNIQYLYSRTISTTEGSSGFDQNSPNHIGIQFIDFKDRTVSNKTILEQIRERVKDISGVILSVDKQEEGPPTGPPVNIEISGDDFKILGQIAEKIKSVIRNIPHVEDIKDDYEEGFPSMRVKVDRQKAALLGLSTDLIGFALKTAYNGLDISTYREEDEDYDITVQLPEKNRKVIDVLKNLLLPTSTGQLVPLTTVATIDYSGSLGPITRIDNQRVVTVKANVDEDIVPGAVIRQEAEKLLQKFDLPVGYKIRMTGEQEEQDESQAFLSKTFIIAIFLIALILVAQFNSLVQPFIIMTSVILSLGGVFLGLFVYKMPFGIIMTGVGVISLAGVVVNNAIVLLDYINKLIERGYSCRDAAFFAGCTRLRPVYLTAMTTILGLIPMATGISIDFRKMEFALTSEASQWWQSMAAAVIFGLGFATLLTLIVVPVLYTLLDSAKKSIKTYSSWIKVNYWKPYHFIANRISKE
jgi:multidrug efflux pump